MLPSRAMFRRQVDARHVATLLFFVVVTLLCQPRAWGQGHEPINIVVTIPVLKDLAEQVGGPYVRVTSLLNGYENEHTYSPKPSDLVAVSKAQLLFEIGIGLEVWVGSLVKNAGSQNLRVVTTSQGIGLIGDRADHHGTRAATDGTEAG